MSRSERWSTSSEIKRHFLKTNDPHNGAGPVVCVENGRKYSDDSQLHIGVIGRTGKGKSQCCSLPYMREVIQKGESLIMLDPKGEGYRRNACFIPEHYQRFCVDFRNPRRSPTKWNPLATPYHLFRSPDPDDQDISSSMLSEIWNGVYPYDGHSDKFWTDSSVNYAKGLTYGLFETASKEQITLDSVAVMMEQSEIRLGPGTALKVFYDSLPLDSLAKRNLATYVTAPNDTRASIHSVAASGLEVFSRSRGLMEMLSEDTLDITNIDVHRPFVLVVITPDETDVYDALAGILISQVSQHLIRVAQDLGGRLPIRVNIILEELGSVGKSIPTLANLMVASRSRNMRLMLVLQSNAQLVDVYGKSKAETISSCIGITIGFSTNSWETLTEWSQRCGEKQIETNGHIVKEPLITAAQLAAMPTGTALFMVDNRHKFIAHLPFYDEMYDNSAWEAPKPVKPSKRSSMKTLDFESFVKNMRKRQLEATLSASRSEGREEFIRPPSPVRETGSFDINSLVARIDAKIAELEAKEEAEKKGTKQEVYRVVILNDRGNTSAVAKAVADTTGMPLVQAIAKLGSTPVSIPCNSKKEAIKALKAISDAGGAATIRTDTN